MWHVIFSTSYFESFTTVLLTSPKSSHKKNQPRHYAVLRSQFPKLHEQESWNMNLLESADPTIIMGSECWMNLNIHTPEMFPPIYDILRKDRKDGNDGVLIGLKNDFIYVKLAQDQTRSKGLLI